MRQHYIEQIISEQEIKDKVQNIANQIEKDYSDKTDITAIGLLKGSAIFFADLIRNIKLDIKIDFMTVSSYGQEMVSSNNIKIINDLRIDIKGSHIIIIDDIIDTGKTLDKLIEYLKEKKPATIKTCTLLNKPKARTQDIQPNYQGFEIEQDVFAVGYGIDYAEKYRNKPCISKVIIKD